VERTAKTESEGKEEKEVSKADKAQTAKQEGELRKV